MKQIGNKLIADAGKMLYCTFNGVDYGTEVSLGKVWYDSEGNLLKEPYMLTIADFEEVDDPEIVQYAEEVKAKVGDEPTYAEAKREAVKLRYSNDDQIALMLNYAEQPDEYRAVYEEMQRWREVAGAVAKMIVSPNQAQSR